MTRLIRTLSVFLSATVFLAGCTSLESTTNVEWQTHQLRLANVHHYKSAGKMGYISPQQRQSLNFQWAHAPENTQLRLTTFLGQTALNLNATATGAYVETYDDQRFQAESPQALIHQLTGLNLPIESLNQWLLGRPTEADEYQLNETHTLAWLTKNVSGQQWRLEYLSYQDIEHQGIALPLPKKIKLTQDDITINIIITKWTLTP
ncbi:lipoprotein localization protein LolB [Vibrio sp. JPW-9-11-11]|uniref:lipoprotein insertase outer membrane protein LolB n=1 Tax=Vibrio sp. JPW-9-11-11 TaxID=1416532 RepID=UPI001593479B|nr:lipoprotein insertase outer membrane protein LolB [Vibrio sp. JPW-9-11-11]NVD07192.1 lipoprotein localization protein LolB [Vibrio sp. JPW-9-11-11]